MDRGSIRNTGNANPLGGCPGLPQRTGGKTNNHAKRTHDREGPVHSDSPTILAFLSHDPKTEVEVSVILRKVVAKRHSRQPGPIVMKGTTAHPPPPITAVGPLGISRRTLRVILGVVRILHPFRHIPAHIVEAPSIGLLICYRLRLLYVIPGPIVRWRTPAQRVRNFRARKLVRCAGSRRVFPFGFGWQPIKESVVACVEFAEERLYIPKADLFHGEGVTLVAAGNRAHHRLPLLLRYFRLPAFETFCDLYGVSRRFGRAPSQAAGAPGSGCER